MLHFVLKVAVVDAWKSSVGTTRQVERELIRIIDSVHHFVKGRNHLSILITTTYSEEYTNVTCSV